MMLPSASRCSRLRIDWMVVTSVALRVAAIDQQSTAPDSDWEPTRLSFVESPGGVGLCCHMIDLLVFCGFSGINLRDRTTAAHAAPLRETHHRVPACFDHCEGWLVAA